MNSFSSRSLTLRFSFYTLCTAVFAVAAGMTSGAFSVFPRTPQGEFKNERVWHEIFPQAQGPAWKESLELKGREIYIARTLGAGAEAEGFAFLQQAQFRGRPLVLLLVVDRKDRLLSILVLEHREPAALMYYFEKQALLKDFLPGKDFQELEQAVLAGAVPEVPKMRAFSRELVLAVMEGLRFWGSEKELLAERLGLEVPVEPIPPDPEPNPSALTVPLTQLVLPETVLPPMPASGPAVPGHGRE